MKSVRPEISGRKLEGFSALELEQMIDVSAAAAINNQHPDTFRRNYRHLIEKIGKRRVGVRRRNALLLPPAPVDAA